MYCYKLSQKGFGLACQLPSFYILIHLSHLDVVRIQLVQLWVVLRRFLDLR